LKLGVAGETGVRTKGPVLVLTVGLFGKAAPIGRRGDCENQRGKQHSLQAKTLETALRAEMQAIN